MKDFLTLGKNLKEIRTNMNLTLGTVSELTGVSKTMLSQIERGESIPTLSVVWKISNGLKLRFESLLRENKELCSVQNIRDIKPLVSEQQDVFIYNLVPFSPEHGFEIYYGEFLPGCDYHSDGHLNGDLEYCFILEGKITITVEKECYHLGQGDFISFDAKKEHSYATDTKTVIQFILNYS